MCVTWQGAAERIPLTGSQAVRATGRLASLRQRLFLASPEAKGYTDFVERAVRLHLSRPTHLAHAHFTHDDGMAWSSSMHPACCCSLLPSGSA